MGARQRQLPLLAVVILLAVFSAQIARAHVLFRFAFNFHVKSADDATETEEHLNKTITVDSNQISIKDNLRVEQEAEQLTSTITTAPPVFTDVWAQQNNLKVLAEQKLDATRTAVAQLNEELAPVVGHSDVMAAKVQLISRYLQRTQDNSAAHKFDTLRKFVALVDELRLPPDAVAGGEHSLEYALMKLALEKWGLLKLQADVQEQVLNAEEKWQQYVKTKLVEVAV